jgi:hypothetical protein
MPKPRAAQTTGGADVISIGAAKERNQPMPNFTEHGGSAPTAPSAEDRAEPRTDAPDEPQQMRALRLKDCPMPSGSGIFVSRDGMVSTAPFLALSERDAAQVELVLDSNLPAIVQGSTRARMLCVAPDLVPQGEKMQRAVCLALGVLSLIKSPEKGAAFKAARAEFAEVRLLAGPVGDDPFGGNLDDLRELGKDAWQTINARLLVKLGECYDHTPEKTAAALNQLVTFLRAANATWEMTGTGGAFPQDVQEFEEGRDRVKTAWNNLIDRKRGEAK